MAGEVCPPFLQLAVSTSLLLRNDLLRILGFDHDLYSVWHRELSHPLQRAQPANLAPTPCGGELWRACTQPVQMRPAERWGHARAVGLSAVKIQVQKSV